MVLRNHERQCEMDNLIMKSMCGILSHKPRVDDRVSAVSRLRLKKGAAGGSACVTASFPLPPCTFAGPD